MLQGPAGFVNGKFFDCTCNPFAFKPFLFVNRLARSNMKNLFMYYPQKDIFGVGPEKSVGIKPTVISLGEA